MARNDGNFVNASNIIRVTIAIEYSMKNTNASPQIDGWLTDQNSTYFLRLSPACPLQKNKIEQRSAGQN
jgi:hypothetical protein